MMRKFRISHEDAAAAIVGPGQSFARFVGTENGDTYLGTKRNDRIFGNGGDDTLAGGDGDDAIEGGSGNDTLAGERGDDVVNGGDGDDIISSSDGADTIDGGEGLDRWLGSYAAAATALVFDEASGTVSNGTTIVGIESVDLTFGGGDDAVLLSGRTAASVDGGDGRDSFVLDVADGGFTRSRIRGVALKSGDFDISVEGRAEDAAGYTRITADGFETWSFAGTGGRDTIRFYVPFALTIDGRDGNDRIYASSDNNSIDGGDGDDQITTTVIGQTIDGGDGYDSWATTVQGGITYDQASQTFSSETTLTGIEKVRLISQYSGTELRGNVFNLSTAGDLYLYVGGGKDQVNVDLSALTEGIVFQGKSESQGQWWDLSFGQTLIRDQSASTMYITLIGTRGDDRFLFDTSQFYISPYLISKVAKLDGGAGVDSLTATIGSNVTFEVQQDGTIVSSVGSFSNLETFDLVVGNGDNVVTTGALDDRISVYIYGNGANTLSGGAGNDTILGARGADLLKGDDGDDTLTGNDGDDVLNGGAGNDTLNGGAGSDTAGYLGATSGVTVTVSSGTQDTRGGGIDTLSSIENLNGSSFDDVLTGDFAANRLRGLDGDDRLNGLDGADMLEGGAGGDRLTGGAGADTFVFVRVTDFGSASRDRILDFSHAENDKIDLSAIDPEKGGSDQAFTFIGGDAFTGTADAFEVRVQDQGGGTYLVQGDANHDAVADFSFLVTSGTPLEASDFVL